MATKRAPTVKTSNPWSYFVGHAPSPMAAAQGPTHIVEYANPAFCRLLGQTADQLVGRPFSEILPEMHDCVKLLSRVYRAGKPVSHTEQQYSQPHPLFWSYTIWPLITQDRSVGVIVQVIETTKFHTDALAMNEALILGSVRQHELTEAAEATNALLSEEITERKQAQDALYLAQERLSEHAGELEGLVTERTSELTSTNQQLEAFVYSIAHDLRAPLRSMHGFSEMLVEEAGAGLSEAAKGYAHRISKSALFMDALLCDLLAFSRIAQRRVIMVPVELGSVVQSVCSRLQENIEECNAQIDSNGPWPCVFAHEPTLTQVLFNLVSNALKFVRRDSPPRVRLRAEERGQLIRVWVEDNGVGIAPAYQDQIFRLFTRLHGEEYPGTGIGLAIVQKGVERMGGQAGVESIPGHGSRFWFELRRPHADLIKESVLPHVPPLQE